MRAPFAAAIAAAVLACAGSAPRQGRPISSGTPPLLQLPEDVRPLRYALDLEVVPSRRGFRGSVAIDLELAAPRTVIWLHGRGLEIEKASVEPAGGRPIPAAWAQVNPDGVASLTLPRAVGPGPATLRLSWSAPWDTRVVGLYRAAGPGGLYAATQLEAIYARRVFPGFDEPRFKTPFDVTLTVPSDAVAVSNAPIAAEEAAGEGLRKVRFATTEPLPTYLVFVGVGPFDVSAPAPLEPGAVRDRPLPVRALAPKGHGGELAFALETTGALVPWLERYFALPFPYAKLDQIAVPEFAAGAMENAGAIAYREPLLEVPERAGLEDRIVSARVMAHEIAHEWFGDLVTLPWWTDAWLNESFATWMSNRAVDQWQPEWKVAVEAFRAADAAMDLDSLASSRAIRQPLRAMAEVDNQFDAMSYAKGGAVLGAFEKLIGEEPFRAGIRSYLRAHAHGTGSAEALFAALSRAGGADLGPALSGFTDRPGVPLVSASVVCDRKGARLALSQSRWLPRGSQAAQGAPWQVPVCARWEAGGRVEEGCTLLEEREGVLPLGPECPAWVMPHADAAAYVRWTLAPPDLENLLRSGLAKLSPVEKVSLARNLRAAQQAGATPWADAMADLAALASDPDPDVALEPAEALTAARDRIVPPAARTAAGAYAGRLYRPILSRLGWEPGPGEGAPTRRLRAAALRVLVFTARDPDVRREAARRGVALGGLAGGPARPAAIAPELAETALAAAVQSGGPSTFDSLVARLRATEDAALRARMIAALGDQDDPALAARAAALWRRTEIRPHELRYLLAALAAHAATREALLADAERDFDALAAALPGGSLTFFPLAFSRLCDPPSAGRVRALLEPRLARYPEMRQATAQALERIDACAVEREADGAAAAAFFFARPPPAPAGAEPPAAPAQPAKRPAVSGSRRSSRRTP